MIEIVIVLAPLMLSRGRPLTNKRTVRVVTKGWCRRRNRPIPRLRRRDSVPAR